MKIYEIVLLVVLVVGVVLILAFGFKGPVEDASSAAEVSSMELDLDTSAKEDSADSGSVHIDFSEPATYSISGLNLFSSSDVLTILDANDNMLASFDKSESGGISASATQPEGVAVKNAWSGPPVAGSASYNVYQLVEGSETGRIPLFAITFNAGEVSLTPGEDMVRTSDKSYLDTAPSSSAQPEPTQRRGGRRRGGGGN